MVVTHSSGNHGQAVAWAARQLGLPCTVVVPEGTPAVKCQAIQVREPCTVVVPEGTPAVKCQAIQVREPCTVVFIRGHQWYFLLHYIDMFKVILHT